MPGIRVPVDAPPLQAPANGLILASTTIDDNNDRWLDGTTWAPEIKGDAVLRALCTDAVSPNPLPGTNTHGAASVYEPFEVWTQDTCSAIGLDADEYQARAERAIAAKAEKAVSGEFWTGALTPSNFHLASAVADGSVTVLGGGPLARKLAMATLVQGLADANVGRGFIHCSVALAELWADDGVLERDGNRLVTRAMRHVIVPGMGYLGTGPNGQAAGVTQWAYGTDWVTIRRGPVIAAPGPDKLQEAVDVKTNTATFRAHQAYTIELNGHAKVAAEVTIATP